MFANTYGHDSDDNYSYDNNIILMITINILLMMGIPRFGEARKWFETPRNNMM